MKVQELNKDQLSQLKQAYYCEKNESVSWGELADIDELVTEEELLKEYGSTNFSEDDFWGGETE